LKPRLQRRRNVTRAASSKGEGVPLASAFATRRCLVGAHADERIKTRHHVKGRRLQILGVAFATWSLGSGSRRTALQAL